MTNEQLRQAYLSMTLRSAPPPWRPVTIHVGGVVAVGYGHDTDMLLILTHSGLGVVDCTTGKTLAREGDANPIDPYPTSADGIGPLRGQRIPIAGLWGGGLRANTADGWGLYKASPNWPSDCAILCPPGVPDIDDPTRVTMVARNLDPPIRAIGFSDTGKSFVIANTELLLWCRD